MSPTIVFFGSGPVAAKSLELLAADFEVEAVVTKPRPVHHKGDFPVIDMAEKLGLKTFYVNTSSELSKLFAGKPLDSRLGVVIDYGIVIKQAVIDYFPLGIVNNHFSLLPRWRGADPISFAILSGDKQTGVSLMLINDKLDEGPLLSQSPFELPADINTPELTESLIELSHQALVGVLPLYVEGKTDPVPQAEVTMARPPEPTYSRKLTKADGVLDFTKSAEQLEREVRAFAGWPRSRTSIGDIDVVITKAHVKAGSGQPGGLWRDGKQFGIYTTQNILVIDTLIPAGKKAMSAAAFLAGYPAS